MNKNVLLAIALLLGCGLLIMGFANKPADKKPVLQDQTLEKVEEMPQEKQEAAPISKPAKKTYENALSQAKEEDKHVLLIFTADWCSFCEEMKKTTLQDEAVKKAMEKYVVYTVDTDKERPLAVKYDVSTIPAYVIINNEEKVLKKDKGYKGSKNFERWLKIGIRRPGLLGRNPRG
jgi:thiol:disulfide interchange protein